MAGKFIELKAAAKQLGISPEQLQDMRESGRIHGYKDGASWKFKADELERIASEMSDKLASEGLSFSDSAPLADDDLGALLELDDALDTDDGPDNSSILIHDEPQDDDEQSSSSTVIGKDKEGEGHDSDLKLADEAASDVTLVPESGAGSDVKVVADSSQKSDLGDDDLLLADSEDLSDELGLAEELDFESDDALLLGEELELSPSDDDDAVLADSEDSDLAIDSEDSGIGLASPSDSGLSLEEDASEAALELPEDDDMISLEDDMMAAGDDASQLQQDEEFLLSPSDEMLGDDSSDSGSQVIALDDSGAFEDDSDVAAIDSGEAMLIPEEADALDVPMEPIDGAVAVAGALPIVGAEAPEAEYSAWNLVALLFVVILLSATGMLMADIVRNMWGWNGESTVASGLANTIIEALGMK